MPQSPGQVGAAPLLPLLLLLACCAAAGGGARELPYGIWSEQQLQLWNKISDACSSFLSTDSRPQASTALRELCFMVMEILPKLQFLFHYSKTQKLGNSNVVSSVVHPLLQLVPQLHERRMKRFQANEAFRSPFANRRRGYFLFRPRNGRSAGFI
ncbi:neuromedin-U isoform X2 [Octodon degus]|uniref:Neuromedin-U isoform X2 n=1 Tax=Octodon degus TaxID=10160 RepID=A0A6P6E3B6_OCTDE|nr:neuromedin-U isoform X2 [Octodon degus]